MNKIHETQSGDPEAGVGCFFIVAFIFAILVVLMLFAMTLVAFA